jgi:hypothetical protein
VREVVNEVAHPVVLVGHSQVSASPTGERTTTSFGTSCTSPR